MKNPLCFIGLHFWNYRKEKHNVTNHPCGRQSIRVLVRECVCCGHREHHGLPRIGGKLNKWQSWDSVSKDATIELKNVD